MSITTFISLFSFLIDPTFWSRIGFLISYIATSFLVLEVLRLIYTDVNKREVEKFLESYSKQRPVSPPRKVRERSEERITMSIADLDMDRQRPVTPPRVRRRVDSAAATPESEKTLVDREERRRRRVSQSPPHVLAQHQASPTATASPVRKLRKRSDTLNSSSSGEARRPVRRHREASPASEAGSKASSRHGSPRRKEERKMSAGLGMGLGKVMRGVKV